MSTILCAIPEIKVGKVWTPIVFGKEALQFYGKNRDCFNDFPCRSIDLNDAERALVPSTINAVHSITLEELGEKMNEEYNELKKYNSTLISRFEDAVKDETIAKAMMMTGAVKKIPEEFKQAKREANTDLSGMLDEEYGYFSTFVAYYFHYNLLSCLCIPDTLSMVTEKDVRYLYFYE